MSRFALSFEGWDPPQTLAPIVASADRAGLANLWVASHLLQREPITTAAMTLAASQRIGVALMAMSPYTVHPVHATMAAATLDEYFPGRVQLCFGVGAPRDLQALGLEPVKPLQTMREAVGIARSLLAGETLKCDGERFRISAGRLAMGARQIPIKLAASGPHMLALAGEISDGVLISAATSPQYVRWTLDQVRSGEARGGRVVEKAALVFCSVDDEETAAHDRLRRLLGYILRGGHHARNLALAGSTLDQARLAAAYAAEDWAGVDALVDDDTVRRHAASGTPSQVRAAFARYEEAGLDEIVIAGIRDSGQLQRVLTAIAP